MSEIYRNSVGKGIQFNIPNITPTSATFTRDGESFPATTNGGAVAVPFSITKNDGPFSVNWTFTEGGQTHTVTETHEVVTPLFYKSDMSDDPDFAALTDEKFAKLESLVRKVVEAHTGQSFGLRKGYTTAFGSGTSSLMLNERVASLDDAGYRVASGGYALFSSAHLSDDVNIKVPAEEEAFYASVHGLVTAPGKFRKGTRYRVHGTFGWDSVPEDVKLAALALAEEFSCDESLWRDRYLRAISAADWRFDYHDRAFSGTGSATADQLLSKYVVNRAVVI